MNRILLHLGLPKTASTFLQRWVFPRLAAGRTSYRGKTSTGDWCGEGLWRGVRNYCLSGDVAARCMAAEEVGNLDGNAIFSSEDFLNPFGFRPGTLVPEYVPVFARLDRFMALVPDTFQVRLLVVIRRQQDWLPSFHFECLKQGYFTHQDQTAFWQALNRETSWARDALDYHTLTQLLQNRYEKAELEILPMETLVQSPAQALVPSIAFLDPGLSSLEIERNRENARSFHGARARLTGADYAFMRRRLLRQIAAPRLPVRGRLNRAALLLSGLGGRLKKEGLPRTCEVPGLVRKFATSNRHLDSATGHMLNLEGHGYLDVGDD